MDSLVILVAVDVLSHLRAHEQSLYQTIHVACCPLVRQSNIWNCPLAFLKTGNFLLKQLKFMDSVVLAILWMWIGLDC